MLSIEKRLIYLSMIGIITSFYLTHHHLEINSNLQIGESICSINESINCDSVARSEYSHLAGIPISLIGLFYYLSLFSFLVILKNLDFKFKKGILVVFSTVSVICSISLGLVSWFAIKSICIFCCLIYLINILIALLSFKLPSNKDKSGASFKINYIDVTLFAISTAGIMLALCYFPNVWKTYFLEPRYNSVYNQTRINELVEKWKLEVKNPLLENSQILATGLLVGKENAPIKIVEFSDYECPFCKKVSPVLEKLVADNEELVNLTILNYPLDESCNPSIKKKFHDSSCQSASLVICENLAKTNKNFLLHKFLIASTISSKDNLKSLASTKFSNTLTNELDYCLNSNDVKDSLANQIDLAIKLGINSTPTIYIDSKKIEFDSFFQIESLLKQIILAYSKKS